MKKIISIVAATIISVASAFAGSEYSVEINLTSKQVTIIQDGKVIQGTRNHESILAVVKLERLGDNKLNCTLESVKGISVPDVAPCSISSDGTASFCGLTYTDTAIRSAFREAMAYLKKTDQPIKMQIYQGK